MTHSGPSEGWNEPGLQLEDALDAFAPPELTERWRQAWTACQATDAIRRWQRDMSLGDTPGLPPFQPIRPAGLDALQAARQAQADGLTARLRAGEVAAARTADPVLGGDPVPRHAWGTYVTIVANDIGIPSLRWRVSSPANRFVRFSLAPATVLPPKKSKPSRELPLWSVVDPKIMEWLADDGAPAPGDGGQAHLVKKALEFIAGKGFNEPSRSTVQEHVKRCINAYLASLVT